MQAATPAVDWGFVDVAVVEHGDVAFHRRARHEGDTGVGKDLRVGEPLVEFGKATAENHGNRGWGKVALDVFGTDRQAVVELRCGLRKFRHF